VSTPVIESGRGSHPRETTPGRRAAIASLLMVPALLVSWVAAYFVGTAVQSALGLAENEMLSEAGVWGVIAAVPLTVLIVVPQIVGIVLGVRARRLGERRLGTVGVTLNTVIAVYVLVTTVLGLVLA
jgi:hypothetical protein